MPWCIWVWDTKNKHYSLKPTTERAANTHKKRPDWEDRVHNNNKLYKDCEQENRTLYTDQAKGTLSCMPSTIHNEQLLIHLVWKFVNMCHFCIEYMTTDYKIFQIGLLLIQSCIYYVLLREGVYVYFIMDRISVRSFLLCKLHERTTTWKEVGPLMTWRSSISLMV